MQFFHHFSVINLNAHARKNVLVFTPDEWCRHEAEGANLDGIPGVHHRHIPSHGGTVK